ncbi:ABC transporter ATP-binding protein [Erysipelothrix sp. HDW6B]|uniref:ABC transporter ATP-binding protein n=1 Tax=Erysipelothrix sp. HDW6B TaxID=2714929 RepID=UPI00272DF0B1|nr:ABC transporter ATP-binding protein [Erysipelothrix sp. HDW6B]
MMIEFKNVTKTYGNKKAVDNVDIKIETGSFVCFIGTSGSGKTTTMRMINRMIDPSRGTILIDGEDIQKTNEVALRRKIGYVIQQIGLMPHMSIYENIVMVPKLLKWDETTMREKAETLMKRVDLPMELLDAYPSELSGGMQQRVGVIRALAADQDIILMDEPFGALDPITRDALQRLVKQLQRDMNKTIIFVTHDMDEALALSDKIVVMDHGKVVQQGSPKDILTSPANDFVRNLVGEDRLHQATFEYNSVEQLMIKPIKVNASVSIAETVRHMQQTRVDDILVVDDENVLIGRVDIRALMRRNNREDAVQTIMKQVTYIHNTTTIRDAIYYIQELGHRNISVVDSDGKLVGIVTRAAVVGAVYDAFWRDYEPQEDLEVIDDELSDKASSAVAQNGGAA